MKKVIVSVINDLVTDQRVHKVCTTLINLGYDVTLVGRKQHSSLVLEKRKYTTLRMNLLFEKGVLFYLSYNVRLFFYLLFNKCGVLVSNDLDTLLPNYLVSVLKRVPLVYDTHEIFTEVPELQNSLLKKKTWLSVEKIIFPKLKYVFTVNQSIADWYKNKYGIELKVVRNIPRLLTLESLKSRSDLGLPADKKILIIQGSGINMHRGAEEAVRAMKYVTNAILLIIGGGDIFNELKKISTLEQLTDRVYFINKLPFAELMQYTRNADIGLTLDKASNINYRFSLPNKLFDYLSAGIAVLASPLVELQLVIKKYNVGDFIDSHEPEHIATKINAMLSNVEQLNNWKENAKLAAQELTWENEEKELISVYNTFL